MSLAVVRPYFRNIIDTLSTGQGLGYVEHRDAFNYNNIPGTELDQAYHLETGAIVNIAVDQLTYTIQFPVTVRLFRRGYNDTVQAHEDLIADTDSILAAILDPANKLDGTLFNVIPGSINYVQLSFDNDNWIVGEITFQAITKLCF